MNADQREVLTREFAATINRYSIENDTNTPDHILARALVGYLEELERLIMTRANWYGRIDSPGQGPIDVKREESDPAAMSRDGVDDRPTETCGATKDFGPTEEAREAECMLPKGHDIHQDEILGEWRDE